MDLRGRSGRGTGKDQPGGFFYNLLDHLEQENLRDSGLELSASERNAAIIQRVATPIPLFHCPTRRRAKPYPDYHGARYKTLTSSSLHLPYAGRSDYAVNAGDQSVCQISTGPSSIAAGDDPSYGWHDTSGHTGIAYERSEVKMAHVRDGASNTYMIAEKYLNPDSYLNGYDGADNENLYVGYDNDNHRNTHPGRGGPLRDRPGYGNEFIFGSAHAPGFQVVFCDGSVQMIQFSIDPEIHRRLGNRRDQLPVDASEF